MLVEVYSGTRPGRPLTLLLVTAAALCGALGLAFVQVRAKGALAPERRLRDTPLLFRPPAAWIADAEMPGEFYLPLHEGEQGAVGIERRVRFDYRRLPTFVPPERIIVSLDVGGREWARSSDPRPTRLAGLPAVQVRRKKLVPFHGRPLGVETVLRVACSPRGDVVLLEYTPLTDFTFADQDLIEDLARAARLDRGLAPVPAAEALARAGIRWDAPVDTVFHNPELDGVAGMLAYGALERMPRYALAAYRTWLPDERRPRDLLREFAAERWQVPADTFPIDEESRGEGGRVAWMHNIGTRSTNDPAVTSVGVLARGEQALLLLVYADEEVAAAADRAARDALQQMQLDDAAAVDIAGGLTRGAEFVEKLRKGGARPWWGALETRHYFRTDPVQGGPAFKRVHTGLGQNAADGHEGYEKLVRVQRAGFRGPFAPSQAATWRIDGAAEGYTHRWLLDYGPLDRSRALDVTETREAGSRNVTRRLRLDNRTLTRRFECGPAFMPPPVETVMLQYAAGRPAGGWWVYEVSAPASEGTHYVVVRSLGQDAQGRNVVLYQEDFAPGGIRFVYDEEDLVQIQTASGVEFERIADSTGESIPGLAGGL